MQSTLPMHLSPRCGAYARRTRQPCRNGAMANGRCRMHGGKSTGAPKGNNNAYVHGNYTVEAVALRKTAAALRKAINSKIDFALMMGRGMVRTEKTEALHRTINEQIAAALTMNREAALQAKQRARSGRQRRRDA